MTKWGKKAIPVLFYLTTLLCLALSGVAMHKWG